MFALQYFETDDQEFYKTKVCFILNNDVSEMDLVFAEEKYSKSGQLEKVTICGIISKCPDLVKVRICEPVEFIELFQNCVCILHTSTLFLLFDIA